MLIKLGFFLVLSLAFDKVYCDEPESVVGGTNASPGELPYQVSLQLFGVHICGGTIVSSTHIVTAAHCLDRIVSAPWIGLTVVSGSVTLDPEGQSHRIRNVRIHPDFVNDVKHSWVNDAALIYLERPMRLSAQQKPIPLATSEPPLNAPLTLSGWGRLSARGKNSNHLQKATVYYVSPEECQKAYPTRSIFSTHLCALNTRRIGFCKGDSGGPLVYEGRLVGIVSWATSCAAGYPDVYTRVSQYSDFFSDVPRV